MSRTRRAMLASTFAYAQYAMAIVISIVVVPLVLAHVDIRAYGLWLAASDLLVYIGLLDLGVFGVLPWLVAQADGERDVPTIRRALSNAMAGAALIAAVCGIGFGAAWSVFPDWFGLSDAERGVLAGPLLIVLAATLITLPANVCGAALAGMQDVRFSGAASLARLTLNAGLTIGLLLGGWGLYAVALGSAVPALVNGAASAVRLRMAFPAIATGWPQPSLDGLRWLAATSVGAWLGSFGWRLLSASNSLVLAAAGNPELVPLYSCTSRLVITLTQMAWIVPDSGLIGLAQLHGEGRTDRLRAITHAMVRLHLILAGAVMTVVLAVNPSFVSWWVSEALFGGHWLNTLLAAGVAVASLGHAGATIVSVLGRRLEIGLATLANGVLQVTLAYALARTIGFQGIAVAAIVAAAVTLLPVGLRLLGTAGTPAGALLNTVWQWLARASLPLLAALAVGLWVPSGALWRAALLWVPVGAVYVWMVRPLLAELPVDPRFRAVLAALRLMPVADVATARPVERVL